VGARGERFLNESTSYRLFGIVTQQAQPVPAYLVTDSQGMRKYALGMVRLQGMGLSSVLADSYGTNGQALEELVRKLGLLLQNPARTVQRFNGFAGGQY
jgi:hypothetical protein